MKEMLWLWVFQVYPALVAGIIIVISTLVINVVQNKRLMRKVPPGDLKWSLDTLKYVKKGFAGICTYEGDGPRKIRVLWSPVIVVRKADHIKIVLNGTGDLSEVEWPPATKSMLGHKSVIIAGGAYHTALRRLLGPCFAPQAIENYLPAIQSICDRYCAEWASATARAEGVSECPASAPARAVVDVEKLPKLQQQARLLAFEVMPQVVVGFRFSGDELLALSGTFDRFTSGMFSLLPVPIPGSGYAKAVAARQVLAAAVDEQIDSFKAAAQHAGEAPATGGRSISSDGVGVPGGSVIERLMGMRDDKGKPLSRDALQDLAISLLFAGHETTAISIMRLMLRLRARPEVVARLRQEQGEVVMRRGDKITGAALRDMRYLDAVVKEGWRIDAIVPSLPRRAKRDFTLAGYTIPKGWVMFLGLEEVPKQAPSWRDVPEGDPMDPRVFNPDRWHVTAASAAPSSSGPNVADSDDEAQTGASAAAAATDLRPGMLSSPIGMLPSSMLTFGTGPRYCLGANLAWAEIKVFLAVMVRRYEFAAALEHMEIETFPATKITGVFPILVHPLAVAAA